MLYPLLIAGAVATAFFLGKKKAAPSTAPSTAPSKTLGELPAVDDSDDYLAKLPRPPIPTPDAPKPLMEGSAGNFDSLWDGLKYGVEVYPPGALTRFPPPYQGELVASFNCNVIAVSDGWWDVAGAYAQSLIDEGLVHAMPIYEKVAAKYLPNCQGKDTPAHQLLRAELLERIGALFGPLPSEEAPPPPTGQAVQAEFVPIPQIQISLGAGAQIFKYSKPGVGVYTIVVEPKKLYNPGMGQTVYTNQWRVWKPGIVAEHNVLDKGYRSDPDDALAAAQATIDAYPIQNPSQRRRRGALYAPVGLFKGLQGKPRRNLSTLRRR